MLRSLVGSEMCIRDRNNSVTSIWSPVETCRGVSRTEYIDSSSVCAEISDWQAIKKIIAASKDDDLMMDFKDSIIDLMFVTVVVLKLNYSISNCHSVLQSVVDNVK